MPTDSIALPLDPPSRGVHRPAEGAFRAPWPELRDLRQRLLLRALLATLGRSVEVEGARILGEVEEPSIFALNHSNSVESVLAPAVLIHLREGRGIHFLADWMYLHLPLLGALLRLSSPIPVYGKPARWRLGERLRQAGRRAPVVEACVSHLLQGRSLGLFPEGRRNPDPRSLLRGRHGLGEVVLRTGVPVVPVGLHYPAARRLGRAPHLGRLVLRVGDPLRFVAEREHARGALPGERRRLVQRVVATTMAALATLSGKSYPFPLEGRARPVREPGGPR